MINLYTRKSLLPNNMELISDVDTYFNNCIYNNMINFDDIDNQILAQIDKSSLSNMSGYVNTPFSYNIPVTFISTGAKTLILINHFGSHKVINISQCGENALEFAFSFDNKYYYLSFCNVAEVSVPIRINNSNKICYNLIDLLEVWEE